MQIRTSFSVCFSHFGCPHFQNWTIFGRALADLNSTIQLIRHVSWYLIGGMASTNCFLHSRGREPEIRGQLGQRMFAFYCNSAFSCALTSSALSARTLSTAFWRSRHECAQPTKQAPNIRRMLGSAFYYKLAKVLCVCGLFSNLCNFYMCLNWLSFYMRRGVRESAILCVWPIRRVRDFSR